MRTIALSQGYVTVVDDEDYEDLARYSWHAWRGTRGVVYARRNSRRAEKRAGLPHTIRMHRQILGVIRCPDVEVDHINHDGLDNRRANLRPCTTFQNRGNSRKRPGGSQYKGVSWDKARGKWRADIKRNGKRRHLGLFAVEEDAARAYDAAARAQWSEFAFLNFP